jgi:Helitron helicase-like domain at N-terminus
LQLTIKHSCVLFRYEDRCLQQGIYATMKTSKLCNQTAGGLIKKIAEKSQELEGDLSNVMKKLRGTKEYWREQYGDLQALDEAFGPATFFLTLSCAEFLWPDMREYILFMNKDYKNVDKLRINWLCANDPVSVAVQFNRRFEAFLKNVLLAENGPLGKVLSRNSVFRSLIIDCPFSYRFRIITLDWNFNRGAPLIFI